MRARQHKTLSLTKYTVVQSFASFLLVAGAAYGQAQPEPSQTVALTQFNFFTSIVSGIILAFAFELILTQFSIAAGVTSMGNLTRQSEGDGWDLRSLPSKLGIWALLTASISLFAATWLAVELSGAINLMAGVVLGLVIWGLFYISMVLFEATALSSLVGFFISTAVSGLKSLSSAGSVAFTRSEGKRLADTSALVASAVRDEIIGNPEIRKTRRALQQYFGRSSIRSFEPGWVGRELQLLLENLEIRATVEDGDVGNHEKTLVASVRAKSSGERSGREFINKADQAITDMRREYYAEKDRVSKVVDAALELTGRSEEEARAFREGIENFLRGTNRDELRPDQIKEELDLLFSNPREGYDRIKRHFSQLSPEVVAAVVSRGSELTEEEANAIIDAIIQAAKDTLAMGITEWNSTRATVTQRIRDYLNSLERPEISYDEICHDIEEIIADPRSGPEVLRQRINALDRETLTAILASRKDISEEDARKIIERIEGVRDECARKAELIKDEVEKRVEQARLRGIELAEFGRRRVEAAAWWAFATATVSAIASMIGAFAAIKTV